MPNNPGTQDLCGDSGSKPKRTRKPSVARVIQQMKRAGVEIAGCEINPRDGTVRVLAGKPIDGVDIDDTTPIDRSEWG
jgi:hypothetical protein